jgi:hypothetical protein
MCNTLASQKLAQSQVKEAEFFIENALVFGSRVSEHLKGLLYLNVSSLYFLKNDMAKAKLY